MAHDEQDDNELDFEAFLREKEKQWTKPAVELTTTDRNPSVNLDEQFVIQPAADAVASSSEEPKSEGTTGNIQPPSSTSAPAAGSDVVELKGIAPTLERRTEITVHKHPIVGVYTNETTIAWQVPQEITDKYFNREMQKCVTELTLEQTIQRTHKIMFVMSKLNMMAQAGRAAIAQHRSKLNDAEREKSLEMDREEAKKYQTRRKVERTRKRAEAGEAKTVAPKKQAKTPFQKRADFFKSNGSTKEFIIEHFQAINKLDPALLAYINKLFA